MKKIYFVLILLGALTVTNHSFAQVNIQADIEQQELSDEALDSIVNEAYLMVISDMESDCECALDEDDAISCSQIARLIGVIIRRFTEIDPETIDNIEGAIEEICEILKEEN
jgi:hypothetical protein